jgi:hypothetical protein
MPGLGVVPAKRSTGTGFCHARAWLAGVAGRAFLLAAAFQLLAERSYCGIWVRLRGVALVVVTVVKQ